MAPPLSEYRQAVLTTLHGLGAAADVPLANFLAAQTPMTAALSLGAFEAHAAALAPPAYYATRLRFVYGTVPRRVKLLKKNDW